jgi:hypothetical protein
VPLANLSEAEGFQPGSAQRAEKRSGAWCFVILLIAVATVLGAFGETTSGKLFYYDEADYMYAGTRGFVSNYLDRPSLSTVEFVREGLKLARDRSQRSNMSRFIRGAGDITFYRHYHGPIYAYWIALVQKLGFDTEADYRGSGLALHGLVAILIFVFFRIAFPGYAPAAALAAALAFLTNRTALVAGTMITQHMMFALMAALTLFPLALFCRTGQRPYWYISAAALGVAFSTVETSFILVLVVIFVVALTGFHRGWKATLGLLLRGVPVFLAAILVVWPKGVLALGGMKGYIYLGYIALVKKTFTPISPVSLWTFKFRTYPEEFILPILALLGATVFWKRLRERQAAVPYIAYAWMFVAVTMVVTAPYVYYHVSMMMSCAVVTGIVFGEIWQGNAAKKLVASVVLVASLIAMDARYYSETKRAQAAPDSRVQLLRYLRSGHDSQTLYLPYSLVPTVHYYMPDLNTVGYDDDWQPATLAEALNAPDGRVELLCEQRVCSAVESQMKNGARKDGSPVMEASPGVEQEPLFSLRPDRNKTD